MRSWFHRKLFMFFYITYGPEILINFKRSNSSHKEAQVRIGLLIIKVIFMEGPNKTRQKPTIR